jgi:hypothetical protein
MQLASESGRLKNKRRPSIIVRGSLVTRVGLNVLNSGNGVSVVAVLPRRYLIPEVDLGPTGTI